MHKALFALALLVLAGCAGAAGPKGNLAMWDSAAATTFDQIEQAYLDGLIDRPTLDCAKEFANVLNAALEEAHVAVEEGRDPEISLTNAQDAIRTLRRINRERVNVCG